MDKEELLKVFLGGFPESENPKDRERFLKYAVACAIDSCSIDLDAMRSANVSEERIHELDLIYPWIKDTVGYTFSLMAEEFERMHPQCRTRT